MKGNVKLPDDVHRRLTVRASEHGLKYYEYVVMALEYYEKAHSGNGEILVARIPDRERRDLAKDYAEAIASVTDEWLFGQIRKLTEGIVGLARGEKG